MVSSVKFLSTLIPSSLAQKAGVYDEAKALNASEEKAREYSNYGGLLMGLMDRVVPAVVIKDVIRYLFDTKVSPLLIVIENVIENLPPLS